MEVTRKNFKEALPLVQDSIEKADFIVIDTEFTGLINGRDVSIFDSPQEYYSRLLNGCTDFMLIQYGISAFYWDNKHKYYMNDTYNFYIFPRGRPGPEKVFLCQSSSLDFLASQGFDFNKLIKEGISFMTEPTEARLRELLTERQKLYSNEKDNIIIPEENRQYIKDICIKVREFLDKKESEEMEIDRCNAFVRKLLFQELGNKFKNEAYVETKILENKDRVLKVTRITENNKCNKKEQKKEKEWEEFEEAVGFTKVARMISQSGKLVIGHNMVLDVIHTLNNFFQPLPCDYDSFKEFTHCMFPKLLDTKYMSSLPPFKDKVNSSVLQHLLITLSESPFTLPKTDSLDGRGYKQADEKHHEAGYDAFVTGLCFLAMHSYLANMRGDASQRVATPTSAVLKPFLNKLFLAKTAHQDSPYINLTGTDPTPSRDHVFHLTFPKEWQRNDINQLFSPFGPITVQFLDDSSALVALSRREQARDVVKALANCKTATLVSYLKYKHLLTKSLQPLQDKQWRRTVDDNTSSTEAAVKRPAVSVKPSLPVVPTQAAAVSDGTPVRRRTTSVSTPEPLQSRKRTPSGVFKVDETEPPPKKAEPAPRKAEPAPRKAEAAASPSAPQKEDAKTNGRRKTPEKDNHKKKLQAFDTEAKTLCVAAFKESDSWD